MGTYTAHFHRKALPVISMMDDAIGHKQILTIFLKYCNFCESFQMAKQYYLKYVKIKQSTLGQSIINKERTLKNLLKQKQNTTP